MVSVPKPTGTAAPTAASVAPAHASAPAAVVASKQKAAVDDPLDALLGEMDSYRARRAQT